MAYDSYLVREEDGTSLFTLEDGSGSILLETAVEITDEAAADTGSGVVLAPPRQRPRPPSPPLHLRPDVAAVYVYALQPDHAVKPLPARAQVRAEGYVARPVLTLDAQAHHRMTYRAPRDTTRQLSAQDVWTAVRATRTLKSGGTQP